MNFYNFLRTLYKTPGASHYGLPRGEGSVLSDSPVVLQRYNNF